MLHGHEPFDRLATDAPRWAVRGNQLRVSLLDLLQLLDEPIIVPVRDLGLGFHKILVVVAIDQAPKLLGPFRDGRHHCLRQTLSGRFPKAVSRPYAPFAGSAIDPYPCSGQRKPPSRRARRGAISSHRRLTPRERAKVATADRPRPPSVPGSARRRRPGRSARRAGWRRGEGDRTDCAVRLQTWARAFDPLAAQSASTRQTDSASP